jgi:homoserine kinase type II
VEGRLQALAAGLLEHHGWAGPWTLRPLAAEGRNNEVLAVHGPHGAYVLKRSAAPRTPAQEREFALLEGLAAQALPFQVAAPIRTRTGAWSWDAAGSVVVLPWLPGGPLPATPSAWRGLGQALRALHAALDGVAPEAAPLPLDWLSLTDLHPAVPDPLALAAAHPEWWGGRAQARTWAQAFQDTQAACAALQGLPRQLIHGDFNSANVLYDGAPHGTAQVSAVLDFEFASVAPRVLDLASAVNEALLEGDSPDWLLARAVLEGYGPLAADERAALPAALRLRQAALGVWGLGQALEAGWTPTTRARLASLTRLQEVLDTAPGPLTSP